MLSILRRAEGLLRPGSLPDAQTHNFFVPQFQTALGTVVHAIPLVESLASAYPSARIVVAGGKFASEIYGGNPHVEAVMALPDPVTHFKDAVRLVRQQPPFAGEPYTTLLTTGNERTRTTLWAALAGPSRRIGFAVQPGLLHTALQWEPSESQIRNNLRLLDVLGATAKCFEPRIYVTAEQSRAAEALLLAKGARADRPRIALVTQTSPTQRKQWPAERWLAVANTLVEQTGADLLFVGTGSEAAAIDQLRNRIPHATLSVAGQTTISELAAIFTRCDIGITLDTGPLHVGRAVGLPMVIIAPAWSPIGEWLPVDMPRYTILKNADFLPPAPDDYIISEVSEQEVLAAALHHLHTPAGDRNQRA